MAGPTDRIRANLTEVVSVTVTGIWLLGLFTGQGWWLPAMLLGYIVVVPLTALMFGDSETIREYWEDEDVSVPEAEEAEPVETLKRRYAAGELTDAEFERKLERLMETEAAEAATVRDEIDRELDRS